VTCDEARERIPWLLNASLEPAEAAALEDHLAACRRCQAERDETRTAMGLFATHASAADLVAFTYGELVGEDRQVVADHLAGCDTCRQEQALVAASRAAMSSRPRAGAWPRSLLAAAAALLALVAGAGWLWTWQRSNEARQRAADREAALAQEVAGLEERLREAMRPRPSGGERPPPVGDGERVARLELELAELRQPQPGLPVIELLAEEMVLRGSTAPSGTVSASLPVTLLLVGEGIRPGERYTLSAHLGSRRAWQATVPAVSAGELTLHLPAGSLAPGDYDLRADTADGTVVNTYRLRVD
jgi:hypothetical protein